MVSSGPPDRSTNFTADGFNSKIVERDLPAMVIQK